MKREIEIRFGDLVVQGELNESPTARLIWEALSIEGEVKLWGDEIYFSIPVEATLDDTATDVVERGDLGYWPPGRAFCIFFGHTPMSQGEEIRPASRVNLIGKVKDNHRVLKKVSEGITVRLEK